MKLGNLEEGRTMFPSDAFSSGTSSMASSSQIQTCSVLDIPLPPGATGGSQEFSRRQEISLSSQSAGLQKVVAA